jgi:Calcineurin-like phosphoesterase
VRILLTADLHYHRPWFEWILRVADRYDLLCIAGDLLDIHHPEGFVPQLIYLYEWTQLLVKLPTRLALCSGNHDLPANSPLLVPGVSIRKDKLLILGEFAKHRRWIQTLRMNHLVAVDDDQKIVRNNDGEYLTVICCPYEVDGRVTIPKVITQPSLILHHEPPSGTWIAEPKNGSHEFSLFISQQQPTWTLSGHVHMTAGVKNHFYQNVGHTCCFNCRQTPIEKEPLPPEPNYISLDTKSREATWFHWTSDKIFEETTVTV